MIVSVDLVSISYIRAALLHLRFVTIAWTHCFNSVFTQPSPLLALVWLFLAAFGSG